MKEFFEFCRKRIDLLIFNISIVAAVSYTHLTLPTIYSV